MSQLLINIFSLFPSFYLIKELPLSAFHSLILTSLFDLQLEQDLENMFFDYLPEPLDCKIFSPLHSQMQVEFGPTGVYYPVSNDFNSGNNGVQYEDGAHGPDDITKFLNSVINNSEDWDAPKNMTNEIGVKLEADQEANVAQVLVGSSS